MVPQCWPEAWKGLFLVRSAATVLNKLNNNTDCGRQNNAPQKCQYINPRNVWVCYFMWKGGFEMRTLRLSPLIWKECPEFGPETSVTTGVLNCGECLPAWEAQRGWPCERNSLTTGGFEEAARVVRSLQVGVPHIAGNSSVTPSRWGKAGAVWPSLTLWGLQGQVLCRCKEQRVKNKAPDKVQLKA